MYKVEQEDLSVKAYKEIKQMILLGELKAGEKLYQESLADKLGISRTPLCSALSQLEKEMLIDSFPRRGFFIKQLNFNQLRDVYDIRLRLEPLGAKEAAMRATEDEKKELSGITKGFKEYLSSSDYLHFKEYDYKFHTYIMKISANEFLYNMISTFNIISLSNLQNFFRNPSDSFEEHVNLVNAIKDNNTLKAEELMYLHIVRARDIISEMASSEGKNE